MNFAASIRATFLPTEAGAPLVRTRRPSSQRGLAQDCPSVTAAAQEGVVGPDPSRVRARQRQHRLRQREHDLGRWHVEQFGAVGPAPGVPC